MRPEGKEKEHEVRVTIYTHDGGKRTERAAFDSYAGAYKYVGAHVAKAKIGKDRTQKVCASVKHAIGATDKIVAEYAGGISVRTNAPPALALLSEKIDEAWFDLLREARDQ